MSCNTNGNDTYANSPCVVDMRKRKRGPAYGSYVDEDTGEVSTVQTSKQVKRAHQKSGKWYKEPTEAELRAWERDEKKQALADRAAKREENKKVNATKRIEKERKDEEVKRQMFQAGKITFTQTLAKKDEDQRNLHSWFGGRPGPRKSNTPCVASAVNTMSGNKEHSGSLRQEDSDNDAISGASHWCGQTDKRAGPGHSRLSPERRQSVAHKPDVKDSYDARRSPSSQNSCTMIDQADRSAIMDLAIDLDMDQDQFPDFDILEDGSAETVILDPVHGEDINQSSTHQFKIPALPNHAQQALQRSPLSPLSPSDVNVRNMQTSMKVSSFKARLENANIEVAPSTQAVRDILSDICTQDLADDLDDLDKENDHSDLGKQALAIISPTETVKLSSPLKYGPTTESNSALSNATTSFDSIADSLDYDSIFFEIDAAEKASLEDGDKDDFDECGLDDDTLLSLPPATQLISSAQKYEGTTNVTAMSTATSTTLPRRPFIKNDSFALDGIDEEDLLARVDEFERSQRARKSSFLSKKKRTLPWNQPGWRDEMENKSHPSFDKTLTDDDNVDEMGTQDTEILSSFG